MKTDEMVRDYLFRAKWCLKEAEMALLRSMAIEYPREHDVGDSLNYVEEKLPSYLKSKIPSLKSLLTELARVRGPAFYGYEGKNIPASEAFSNEYARNTFERVSRIVNLCEKYLQTI